MIALAGIAIFINFLLIIQKIKKWQYFSAILDILALWITTIMFAGTYSGMAAGYIGNMLFSIYLLFNPMYIDDFTGEEDNDKNNSIFD